MNWREYKYLVLSDLYRIRGGVRFSDFMAQILRGEGFKYSFWMRTCTFARSRPLLRFTLYPFARFVLGHYTYRLGISIPPATVIGSGFYIGHFGGIVVSPEAVIGDNCNISQGVTIGQSNRGRSKGFPTLGNNVYIAPGAKIVGNVTIGDNAAIGANCVVTRDVPANGVVVGIPGRVISVEGSIGYVNRTDYAGKICRE